MIEELKPYEALRHSGDLWLGEIPKHWSQKRLWSMSNPRVERNPGNLPLLSVFLDRGVIPYGEGGGQVHAPSLDLSNYQVVHPGDFVLNNQQAWRGSVGVSRHHGIISPAYIVLRLNGELLPAYANCLFRCPRLVDQFVAASKGVGDIQRQVFWPFLRRVSVPIPSTAEQEAIVRFLDHANRHIDQFIRAKKKLIALLNEQKQAIIHRAVTRGSNPHIQQKDSGLPWIGDIPAHWKTPMLGRCIARIEQGWSPVAAEGDFSEDQWVVVTLSSVRRGQFNHSAIKPISRSAVIPMELTLRNGDFLLTRSNTRERVGDVCIVSGVRPKTILCDLIYRLTLRTGAVLPAFLAFQLMSPLGRWQIERSARGSSGTMPKIAQSHIRAWRLLLPPIAEQKDLVAHLVAETAPLTTTIQTAEREIALMFEYRTRLISDVVTGQLDVRAAAAGLPDVEPEGALVESEGDDNDVEDGEAA